MRYNLSYKALALTAVSALIIASCSKQHPVLDEPDATAQAHQQSSIPGERQHDADVVPGRVIIKLKDDQVHTLLRSDDASITLLNAPTPLATALSSIHATKMQRLFPHAGKYEGRSRREGMHLWYEVEFDEQQGVSAVMQTLQSAGAVAHVEAVPVIQTMAATTPLARNLGAYFNRSSHVPYDDPMLSEQWHYHNRGTLSSSVMGADINLYKAWEVTTGTPNVIVCVVDGGIKYDHEDLAENMWVNEAERDGQPGVDDDKNGYVDDIHGWCFVNNVPDIRSDKESHGTHVAGTVAARTNNRIGVAGVAGGDGSPGSGVRLISAAIFRAGVNRDGNSAAAIKYGADNGAVISQNSWGYRPGMNIFPESVKAAIDYFIKYAGCDESGNQLPDSPMKGGVVIFAAGNDNLDYKAYPAYYDRVIAVAAVAPNFERAAYSNYGSWVDIAAPGGDQTKYTTHHGVLSTFDAEFSQTGLKYMKYQGTSMACPHVSGVAALVLSKFGGPGYTNEMLRERLLSTVYPIDIDALNPGYEGKLGAGYLDAYAALTAANELKAPQAPVIDTQAEDLADFTALHLSWAVPADEDDGAASRYQIFVSEKELTPDNYRAVGRIASPAEYINGLGREAGEVMKHSIPKLIPGTTYYVALIAYDRWGNASKVSIEKLQTRPNNSPIVLNLPSEPILVFDILGQAQAELQVTDPDGHTWRYAATGDHKGVTMQQSEDKLRITIRPVLSPGDYTLQLRLTDELGAQSTYDIPFAVVHVGAPVLRQPLPGQLLSVQGQPQQLQVANYVEPVKHLSYTYQVAVADPSIADATIDPVSGELSLVGKRSGRTVAMVEISNGHMSAQISVDVMVTKDTDMDVYSVWPLPIRNTVSVWLNPKHKHVSLELMTMDGVAVLRQKGTADDGGVARVDASKVAPGQYILRVHDAAGKLLYSEVVLKR